MHSPPALNQREAEDACVRAHHTRESNAGTQSMDESITIDSYKSAGYSYDTSEN